MSRKKLKAFDPANSNKSQREAYLKLQEGPNIRDLAPKSVKDENRLSGAARRFAMQLIVSKKLDERDRDRQLKKEGKSTSNGKQADYRVKLNEQIAAAAKAKQEQINRTIAKAERKAQKQLTKQQGLTDSPASTSSTPSSSTITSLSAPNRTAPSSSSSFASSSKTGSAVSLSKSVDEQRQARKERAANEMSQAEKKSLAAAKAAEAAAAAEEEARAAAAAASTGFGASAPQKVAFSTEMRPGESFRSYQARLVQEKRAMMEAEVTATKKGLSERKKRKLAEKEEKRKAKRDPKAMDADERRVLAERMEKERKDAAIAAAKESKKGGKRNSHNNAADDDDGYESPSEAVAASAASSRRAREFSENESVSFGDIVDRPPTLTKLPKSKTLEGKVQHDRIIDGLLLMQQKNSKKKKKAGNGAENDDADAELQELEKAEWIAKQMDQARRERLAQEQKEKSLASLREASIAAYKASKKRKREEEATATPSADPNKKDAYVPKRILKKQKRNRERMKQFKDNAEMDLDLEIEMADNFD